jgi:hypothetical protein
MNTPILDRLIRSVDVESNLLPFLRYSGWEQIDIAKARWIVVHGEQDVNKYPLELVFPLEKGADERRSYIVKAIELLAALKHEPMQLVVQSIINYDRDMLYIRNTDTEEENAIAFNLAVDQINNLKRTIQFSACSERDAKPYFPEITPVGRRATRSFLFGHTFAGSFGFTIEAPRLPDPPQFIQPALPVNSDFPPPPVDVPFERRVVERIARGLVLTKRAEDERDHGVLLREYASGFNSNMCSAVVGISQDKKANVEFRIAWSPKIRPGDDVAQIQPVRLLPNGYEILEYAAQQLKSLKPEFVNVVGHVRALTSSDNPLSLGTRRAVVVRGIYPGIRRAVDVIVELERDDYAKANDAHIRWQNVQASGIISRSGTGWRLLNMRDFKVLE